MKVAYVAFIGFCAATAVASGALARADARFDEALYAVRINGHEETRESRVLRDASGIIYLSEEELNRWRFVKPSAAPIRYRGASYYPVTDFPGLVVNTDARARRLDLAAPAQVLRPADPAHAETQRVGGSYLSYDLSADGGSFPQVTGTIDYGMMVGSGLAATQLLARTTPYDRHVVLMQTVWEHTDRARGRTLRIGDSTSLKPAFDTPIRFEGVQWSSNPSNADQLPSGATALSAEMGWERRDFGYSPMQLGSFMVSVSGSRGFGERFTARAHVLADATTKLIGVAGAWRVADTGLLSVGIAPNTATRFMHFLGLQANVGRLDVHVDARINGEPYIGTVPSTQPAFGRSLNSRLAWQISQTSSISLSYAAETRPGSLPSHALSLTYEVTNGPAPISIDLSTSRSNGLEANGVSSSLSLPMDSHGRHTLSYSNDVGYGSRSRLLSFKQNLESMEIGTGYEIQMAQDESRYDGASFVWQAPASVSHLQYSRFGQDTWWHADTSGAMIFLNRTHHVGQKIDQRNGLTALRRERTLTLRLVTENGTPVATGSTVHVFGTNSPWLVEADGNVTLSGLDAGGVPLRVQTQAGACSVVVIVPATVSTTADLGTRVCRRTTQ